MSARLAYLNQLLDSSPRDSFLLFAIAKEHEKLGDAAQALLYYERLRSADPQYVGLYYHLGKLHEQLKDVPQAVSVYRAGIRVAQAAGDAHAASELRGALLEWEDPED